MRIAIVIALIVYCGFASAQLNFKTVDSTSYAMYQNKEWKALIRYVHKVNDAGINYYLLNLRKGIALYETAQFHDAESAFKEAMDQNPMGTVAPEYLYWIYQLTDREPEAAEMYELLTSRSQEQIDYKRIEPVSSIYLEGGPKFSSNKELANTLWYAHAGVNHKISPGLKIYHGYTCLSQSLVWGNYTQDKYYIAPSLQLKGGWTIGAGLNMYNYHSNIDYKIDSMSNINRVLIKPYMYDTSRHKVTDYRGDYHMRAMYGTFSIKKQIKGLSITPQVTWFGEWHEPNYSVTNKTDTIAQLFQFMERKSSDVIGTETDSTATRSPITTDQLQIGMAVDYTKYFSSTSRITLGLQINNILRDGNMYFAGAPFFSFVASERFGISGYFTRKGNYPLALFGGSTVLNAYDKLTHRLSLTARFGLSRKVSLYTTFQTDGIEDSFSLGTYNLNSLLIGLKIKL